MKDAGYAHMGVGSAKGAGKAENAAKAAISSPLLETSIAGAHGVIINITSSPDIGLEDVETAAGLITQSAHPDANIIWGTAFDENLSDEMRVTVVATGFDNKSASDLRNSINNAMGGAQSVPSQCSAAIPAAQPLLLLLLLRQQPGRSGSCRKARGRGKQRQPLLRRAAGHPEQAEVRLANNKNASWHSAREEGGSLARKRREAMQC